MNLISTMLGFIGRKIKSLETEVGNINSTLDNVSPAPKVIPIERGGTGATTTNGALDNLFGESPLPISRGGTGVTTSLDAKKTLGIPRMGAWQLSSNINLNSTNTNYEWNLEKCEGMYSLDLGGEYGIIDGNIIYFDPLRSETRLVRVDICAYLMNGFKADSLVTTSLWTYSIITNSYTNTNIRWNARPTISAPYVHMVGSGFVKLSSREGIQIRTNVTSGGGVIGSGIDTRVILTDFGKIN